MSSNGRHPDRRPQTERAKNIAKLTEYCSFRVHYPGKLGTAGACAMLTDEVLSPSIPGYEWVVDYLLRLDNQAVHDRALGV